MQPSYLYLHSPFCVRRCSYCDFAVTVDSSPRAEAWLDAMEAELAATMRGQGWNTLDLRTIYVGGGTPSLLGRGVMAGLAKRLRRFAHWDDGVEWTVEANPESFDAALARDWRAAGVNRLSLGAQTFHADALRWMGRLHGPDGPRKAMRAAREAGFDNVSIDLIFGLPARLERDWPSDLERAVALEPEHLSLYGLTAEPGAPLSRWVREGREVLADEDAYATEYLQAASTLTAAGYDHYEVSNFARRGLESRHNSAYWTGAAYLGLGPGSHSYLPPRRSWNVRDWAKYRGRIMATGDATDGDEAVDAETSLLEQSWLGLRTATGSATRTPAQRALARVWRERGWAEGDDDHVRLTARGWLLLDRLSVEFDARALKSVGATETFE